MEIYTAGASDVPIILQMIRDLAEYEKLSSEVIATEDLLRRSLFGDRPCAEVLLAKWHGECVGFALFFATFSTFLAKPGIYLEDLFVKPQARGQGIGLALFRELAKIARARGCARVEWSVLDWNEPSIGFYKRLGAVAKDEWTQYRLSGEALQALAK